MADKESKRTCFKCGCSPAVDNVKLFRFPKPAVRNLLRCEFWAQYIFPDRVPTIELQGKLHSEHRMLCQKHFKDDDFHDDAKKLLLKSAVPCDENIQRPTLSSMEPDAGPSHRAPKWGINRIVVPVENAKLSEEEEGGSHEGPISIGDFPDRSPVNVSHDAPYTESASSSVAVQCKAGYSTPELQSVSDLLLYEEDVQVVDGELLDPATDIYTEATEVHEGIVCNVCEKQIVGFRYVCVQCADWDHCAACEAGGAHALHAVLRAPGTRAEVQRVADAVREAVRRAEPETVTLHMDVTHEDGFAMDEDNKDDIQLFELHSSDADVTETNPLDEDMPFYVEDSNKTLTDNNHEEKIQSFKCPTSHNVLKVINYSGQEENIQTFNHPTKATNVCNAYKRNEHNYTMKLKCPTEDNVPNVVVYKSENVRVYSKDNHNKPSGVVHVMQQQHVRTTPIQRGGDDAEESLISIKPHNSNLQQTEEMKQIPIEHIKHRTLVVPEKSPLRFKLDNTTFQQHKEKLLASGEVKLKRITQAEVDAVMKRQRLYQDTNSDDSS